MANYNLVSNAKFQPFSFERYLQPYQMIGEAYREVENNFATLEEQAESFRDIANQDINPEAYKLHQDYVSKLNEAVEGLSTRESTPAELRRRMLNMRKEYAQKILPIARASESMKEANAMRDKLGPDAIFKKDRYTSIDDFLGGKTVNNEYISSSALTKKTATITENVMNQIINDPDFISVMDKQMQMMVMQGGGSYDDLMAAISNSPEAQNKFIQIKKQVMQEVGIDDYDASGQLAIEGAINAGLYAGLQKPTTQMYQDNNFISKPQKIAWKMQGFDDEGNIDKNSPIWATKGISWVEETPVKVQPTSSKSTSTRGNRLKESISINGDGKVVGTGGDPAGTVLPYSALSKEEQEIVDRIGLDIQGHMFSVERKKDNTLKKIHIVPKSSAISNSNSDNFDPNSIDTWQMGQ